MRRIWLLAAVCLSGCVSTRGFDRGALYASAAFTTEGPLQITEEEVKKALELRPQLAFPARIAIYLHESGGSEWRWTGKDKERIQQWMDGLKKEGLVADAFFINGMFAKGSTLKELRLSAAQHGADAVLVLKGAYQTDSYVNPAALLNITIVGGYVIPASHRDALFLLQGGLVDVANGFLYATVEAEGEGSIIRPTFTVQDKDAVERAKKQAMDNLGPELMRRMRNLRARDGRPAVRLNQPIVGSSLPPAQPLRLGTPQSSRR